MPHKAAQRKAPRIAAQGFLISRKSAQWPLSVALRVAS